MSYKLLVRVVIGILAGFFISSMMTADYVRWHDRGKQAYIDYETQRFDHYMANPSPNVTRTIAGVLVAVGIVAIYEGIAFLFDSLVRAFAQKASSLASKEQDPSKLNS